MRLAYAHRSIFRSSQFESLEPRTMMSSSPPLVPFADADFVLDYFTDVAPAIQPITRFSFSTGQAKAGSFGSPSLAPSSLANAHIQTGLATANAAYGLTGRGQTVVVIDTGIAYDHLALGGHWGGRVVGGWDFAENDANPYDDPAGSHGTHVAGIIGNDDATNPGVATGVDFVSLRVFADNGSGYFSWVEDALKWVYQNRNAFRNPITTINLSLGAASNDATAPAWSQIEDEFQQLKDAGIFIAAAAGNLFANYGTPGLSYPAASTNVVAVSAVDSSGNMASFSQRLNRAIAAPGVSIRSTIPDYYGNLNHVVDDWASYSGTSMASPYVAGASMLIREALAIAGQINITQDDIYQVMVKTADLFYDPVTAQSYRRLNMQRALDSIMPADDYSSSAATPYNLGTIAVAGAFSGKIERLTDHDYFRFTAAASGSLDFTATTGFELGLRWEVVGAGGSITTIDSNKLTLDVVAGQTYTIGICTTAGVGVYSVTAQTGIETTDLGSVDFRQQTQSVSGEEWFGFTAGRTGALTVEALLSQAGGNVDLKLYDSKFQLIATSAEAGNERIDLSVLAGQRYYVQLLGTNNAVTLRVTNLIGQAGSTLQISGTSGNDTFSFTAGTLHRLVLNGVEYSFGWQSISGFNFDGLAGNDTITMSGTGISDNAVANSAAASLYASWYHANAIGFDTVTLVSGGGGDTAIMYDSAGDDALVANPGSILLTGGGVTNHAVGFSRVEAYSIGGNDQATFHDSVGNDTYIATPTYGAMIGSGYFNIAFGFDRTRGESQAGGSDNATLFDSVGNDVFSATSTSAKFYGAGWSNQADGFASVLARSDYGGWDMAYLNDSAGNDNFIAGSNYAWMEGASYRNCAVFFDLMAGYASTGNDTANVTDSIYNDVVELDGKWAKLSGYNYWTWTNGFDRVNVSAINGGVNTIAQRSAYEFIFSQYGAWA
jgi:subtilisin family serine protease